MHNIMTIIIIMIKIMFSIAKMHAVVATGVIGNAQALDICEYD